MLYKKPQILNCTEDFLNYKVDQSQRDNNFMNYYKPFQHKEFDNSLREDGKGTLNKKCNDNQQINSTTNRKDTNNAWHNTPNQVNDNKTTSKEVLLSK